MYAVGMLVFTPLTLTCRPGPAHCPNGRAIIAGVTIAEDLVSLSHRLADPAADLVILGEGNTSADLGSGAFLVKASGTSLGTVGPDDFVRLNTAVVRATINDPTLDSSDTEGLADRIRAASGPGQKRPS